MRTRAAVVVLVLCLFVGSTVWADSKIKTAFVFHFNQSIVPYADVAEQACYLELLRMLRSLRPTPFVLHISGTLLMEWQWSNSEALDLVREGIVDGQFEILGSTLAQNIIYSIPSLVDNEVQIELHRKMLKDVLGVEPVGFWNAERVWDPSLTDLIAKYGYTYTFVETPILAQSGLQFGELRNLHKAVGGEHALYLVPDDLDFRNAVNQRNPAMAVGYLRAMHRRDPGGNFLYVYAEDAEATGLWDLEAGNSPAQAVDNLRKVLARLAEDPEIEIMKISEYVAEMGGAAQTLSDVTGQPDWMIAPSRARGYADWFDYNANAPELAYFRELYQAVSSRITQVEQAAASNPGALQLIKHARLSLAISQYEFAAVGAGGFDDAMWELARTALVPAFAAEAAAQGMDVNPRVFDINADGVEEIAAVWGDDFYVFSHIGGKLLYWFDLKTGEEIVGSENAFYYGEKFNNDSAYVPVLRYQEPLWLWLSKPELLGGLVDRQYVVRRRVGNDVLERESGLDYGLVDLPYTAALEPGRITFWAEYAGIQIEKTFTASEGGLVLEYEIEGLPEDIRGWRVENGLSPSYTDLLWRGRSALETQVKLGEVLVKNANTGLTVTIAYPEEMEASLPGLMRYGEAVDLFLPLAKEAAEFRISLTKVYEGGWANDWL